MVRLQLSLLLGALMGAFILEKASMCLMNAIPLNQWKLSEAVSELRVRASDDTSVLMLIISDYIFNCNANITQWTLKWHHRNTPARCQILFHFYVLRELQVTRAGCSAVQVGMNTLTHVFEADTSDSSDVLEVLSLFEVPEKERIVVSAGDIVGLVVELGQNCESSKVWISGREVNNVLYRLLTHESSLLHVLSTSCGSFERDRHLSPCVAAVVEVHHENTTTIAFHPPNDNNSVTSNYVSQSENFSSRSSVLGPVNISKIVTTSRATSNDESTTKSASVSNIKENTTPESSSKMQDKKTRLSSLLSNSTKPPSQDHIKNVTTQKSTYSVSTSSFFPVEVLSNDTTNTNILQNNILLLKVGASSCVLIVLGIGLSLVGICVCHFLKSRNKVAQQSKEENIYDIPDADTHNYPAKSPNFLMEGNSAYGSHRSISMEENSAYGSHRSISMEENSAYGT